MDDKKLRVDGEGEPEGVKVIEENHLPSRGWHQQGRARCLEGIRGSRLVTIDGYLLSAEHGRDCRRHNNDSMYVRSNGIAG